MPELPEVQTIVDDLNKKICGRKIVAAWWDWAAFKPVAKTVGHTVDRVVRRGKNILLYLDKKKMLLIHQKMTGHLLVGKWVIEGKKTAPVTPSRLKDRVNGYIHFLLTFNDGRMLGFSDLRKFGKVVFGEAEQIESSKELAGLGPDALAEDLTAEEFISRSNKRSKTIYQTLMDQTVVAGVGNIYASDILWEARVHPFIKANKLNKKQLQRIFEAMRKILRLSVSLRGTSAGDYRDTAGEEGFYYPKRMAYDREGMPCYRCGTKIKRVKKNSRSAFYCSKCQ